MCYSCKIVPISEGGSFYASIPHHLVRDTSINGGFLSSTKVNTPCTWKVTFVLETPNLWKYPSPGCIERPPNKRCSLPKVTPSYASQCARPHHRRSILHAPRSILHGLVVFPLPPPNVLNHIIDAPFYTPCAPFNMALQFFLYCHLLLDKGKGLFTCNSKYRIKQKSAEYSK